MRRAWLLSMLAGLGATSLVAYLLVAAPRDSAPALSRHEVGPFLLVAPAAWQVHGANATFSGGFVQAVVGTVPVPLACRPTLVHVDINCYYEERLPPGSVSIVLGGGAFRGEEAANQMRAQAVELAVDGRPAFRVDHDVAGSYYLAERSATWYIERDVVAAPGNFYTVDAQVRGPNADSLWDAVSRMVLSLRLSDEG